MAGPEGERGGPAGVRAPFPLVGAVVRAFSHSTEDAQRVRDCVRALVGPDAELRESASRGFHRQPLRVIESYVRDRSSLRALLERLRTPEVLSDYHATWEQRLDPEQGAVHFRLAKQPLLEGRVFLEPPEGKGDLVKLELRLQAYPASAKRYREIAAGLLD